MGWIYRSNYAGPDRRSGRFAVRFVERRRDYGGEPQVTTASALQEFFSRGLRWVDHLNYFGPDRRSEDFSFFFLERRRATGVGAPPPLHIAFRQLRVRIINAQDAQGRGELGQRLVATALLAQAQGLGEVADALTTLARCLDASVDPGRDPRPWLHTEISRVESMLA